MRTSFIKKLFLTSGLLLLTKFSFSQAKFDTLVIGPKKYLLPKTKIFHSFGQNSPVTLPSEYSELPNSKTLEFKFKALADSSYEVFVEEKFGGEVTVMKHQDKEYPYHDSISYLRSVADTIQLSLKEFLTLKPYIKSNNKKLFFCASKVDKIYNDTVIIAAHSYIPNGFILSFWQSSDSFKKAETSTLKQTTFILRELYYLKGQSTFYLDRKFVIQIK